MKSYALCPVSDSQINERVSRLNGCFTIFMLIIFVMMQSILPVLFLAVDFLFRASDYSKYSLIGFASKNVVRYFGFNKNIINAGPKIFAARLGFVFCSLIIILFLFKLYLPALTLAGILGLFSFLEAAFGFCIACEIYPLIYRFLYKVKF